ncbi:hypothetical protein [uncultured Dokdonia sp.]|nr:hypothetical protein [uncultured Dokdonia sp.]
MKLLFESIHNYYVKNIHLIEEFALVFLAAKHGTPEAVQAVLQNVKERSETNEQFFDILLREEFYLSEIKCIGEPIENADNMSEVFLNLYKSNMMYKTLEFEELGAILRKMTAIPVFGIIGAAIIGIIDVLKITKVPISKVREEIGIEHRDTFAKWLTYYFPKGQYTKEGKEVPMYKGKKTMSLYDYIKLYNFFLGTDQKQEGCKPTSLEIINRIKNRIIVSKDDLKKQKKKRSKALKEAINFLNEEEEHAENPIPNANKYPYSIALRIGEVMDL